MNHGYAYVHCLYLDFYVPWFTGKQFVLIAFVFRDSFPLCVGESLSGGCIVGAVVLFLILSILVLFLIFFDVSAVLMVVKHFSESSHDDT